MAFTWRIDLNVGTIYAGANEVTLDIGRRLRIDPYGANIGSINFKNISQWSTQPQLGDYVKLDFYESATVGYVRVMEGFVRNVNYRYGIISSMDEATIEIESLLSRVASYELVNFLPTSTNSLGQIAEVMTEANVSFSTIDVGRSTVQTLTSNQNALDLVNQLIQTEMGFLFESYSTSLLLYIVTAYARNNFIYPYWAGAYYDGSTPAIISDTAATNASHLYFDIIEMRSTADNYYTQAVIDPAGAVASQQATKGAKPYYGLEISTLDSTTTQADDLAEYLVNMYSSKTRFPVSVSLSFNGQKGAAAKEGRFAELFGAGNLVGKRFQVIFRGTTYNLMAEGANISSDVDDTRLTIYFSSEAMNNFLILNDDVYGTLDTNRLGF